MTQSSLVSDSTQIYSFNKVHTISFRCLETPIIFPILKSPLSDLNISALDIISVNTFLKSLKLYAKIRSLKEAPLPDIKLEDSETERIHKALDAQWKNPRKELNLFISNEPTAFNQFPDANIWRPIGSISLLNSAGYPYKRYNLLDLLTDNLAAELGSDGNIGISIVDVGFGFLTPIDEVYLSGSYVNEIVVKKESAAPIINVSPAINLTPNISINTGGSNSLNLQLLTYAVKKIAVRSGYLDAILKPENFNIEASKLLDANTNRRYLRVKNLNNYSSRIIFLNPYLEIEIEPQKSFELDIFQFLNLGKVYAADAYAYFELLEGSIDSTVPTPTPTPTPTPLSEEDEIMALAPLTYTKTTVSTSPAGESSSEQYQVIPGNTDRKYLAIENRGTTPAKILFDTLSWEITLQPKQIFETSRFGLWYTSAIHCYETADFTLIEGV